MSFIRISATVSITTVFFFFLFFSLHAFHVQTVGIHQRSKPLQSIQEAEIMETNLVSGLNDVKKKNPTIFFFIGISVIISTMTVVIMFVNKSKEDVIKLRKIG